MPIDGSVGAGGNNAPREVQYVQALLNVSRAVSALSELGLDGVVGPQTIGAIKDFQTASTPVVDGLVEPGKATITALETLIAPILPEIEASASLAVVLSWEPVQEEPQPNEDPTVDDSELMSFVQTVINS